MLNDEIGMREIRYEMMKCASVVYFSPSVIDRMRITRHDDFVIQQIAYRLEVTVAMWRDRQLLKVPANWWQHFKQRFFPAWALKRWPVLFDVYNAAVVLPQVPLARPEYGLAAFAVFERTPPNLDKP